MDYKLLRRWLLAVNTTHRPEHLLACFAYTLGIIMPILFLLA